MAGTTVVAIGLLAVQYLAADDAPADQKSIALTHCRVMLINQVVLASDRVGILAFVEPEEGAEVRAQQVVAGLADEVAAAALAVAEAKVENDVEIRYARKAAELARVEYDRSVDVNRRIESAVTDFELRRLLLTLERSELAIEQAASELKINRLTREQASAELKTYQVQAPFDGIVTRVYKSSGEAVRQGDPILELVSTDRVRIEGDVDIKDVWNIKAGGTRVVVQLDIPGVELDVEKDTFEGKIVFVDVSVQPVTRRVRVWAEVPNRDNILRAGLEANMTIYPEPAP
jgi:RND family efflux transporter MFP subunit